MRARLQRCLHDCANLPPEQMAAVIAAGLVIGVFPVIGLPTGICLLAAWALRVNPAPLLALNQLTSPLQLALFLPLMRAGTWLCRGGQAAPPLGAAPLYAVAGWGSICVPLGVLFYIILLWMLRNRRAAWFNGLETPA